MFLLYGGLFFSPNQINCPCETSSKREVTPSKVAIGCFFFVFLSLQQNLNHKLTYFLSCAANPNPILAHFVSHSFQEISVVLSKAKVVVRAHVDNIVYCLPGKPAIAQTSGLN